MVGTGPWPSAVAVWISTGLLLCEAIATGLNRPNRPNDAHQPSAMVDLPQNRRGRPVAAVVPFRDVFAMMRFAALRG